MDNTNSRNKQINMYLPYSLWEEVTAFALTQSVAKGRRISVSEVFRTAVEEYIRTRSN